MKQRVIRTLGMTGLCVLLAGQVHAQCQRADIDHYLSQGFTPDQITALCVGNPDAALDSTETVTESKPSESDARAQSSHPHALDVLWQSFDVIDVHLTETDLYISEKRCLKFGGENRNGIQRQFCPVLEYRLAREGLEVLGIEKPSVFALQKMISLGGDIEIKLNTSEEDLSTYRGLKKRLLDQYIADTSTVEFKLKRGVSERMVMSRMDQVIR